MADGNAILGAMWSLIRIIWRQGAFNCDFHIWGGPARDGIMGFKKGSGMGATGRVPVGFGRSALLEGDITRVCPGGL